MPPLRLVISFVVLLLLAACDQSGPVAPQANNFTAETEVLPPNDGDETGAGADDGETVTATEIPEGLRGRWGLTPGSCDLAGEAEGLLTITSDELQFYESVAQPLANATATPDSISGEFAFTGEGTDWTRYQSLELQDGKLIRTETDPAASRTYVRCD